VELLEAMDCDGICVTEKFEAFAPLIATYGEEPVRDKEADPLLLMVNILDIVPPAIFAAPIFVKFPAEMVVDPFEIGRVPPKTAITGISALDILTPVGNGDPVSAEKFKPRGVEAVEEPEE
jgi:hypothetical protein